MDRGLGRLDRIELIVDGRGRAGEVGYLIHLDIERERHVMAHDLETRIAEQMRHIAPPTREEVVNV
jgi:hypothetical protein